MTTHPTDAGRDSGSPFTGESCLPAPAAAQQGSPSRPAPAYSSHAEEAAAMIDRITSRPYGALVMDSGDHRDWLALAQVHATLAEVDALRDVLGELAALREHLEASL